MLRLFVLLFAVAALATPARVAAQSADRQKLSEVLPQLYFDTFVSELTVFLAVFPDSSEGRTFFDSADDRFATPNQIISLAGNQLSSFPLGSASAGFLGRSIQHPAR